MTTGQYIPSPPIRKQVSAFGTQSDDTDKGRDQEDTTVNETAS